MNLVPSNANQTMSSREIAELTGKRHDHVLRDIRVMLVELHGEDGLPKFGDTYQHEQNGQEYAQFLLPKRECLILVSGYSVALRAKIIDRWQELEEKAQTGIIAMPDFSNPALAARAWAEQYEARQIAETTAQQAIETKAEIGNRREATAMNTASQAVKRAQKLEAELDRAMQYASIKRMEMAYHGQKFNWRMLKAAAVEMELPAIDIFDANYGTVKAYHADVWFEVYAIEVI